MQSRTKSRIPRTVLALLAAATIGAGTGQLLVRAQETNGAGSSELDQARQAVENFMSQRGNLENASVGSQRTLAALNAAIDRQRQDLNEATQKVDAINRQLEVLKDQRGKAMRQSYITGTSVSYLYALLDSGSLSEFLSKGTYTDILVQRKDRAVESVDEQISRLTQARDVLVVRKNAAETEIATLERKLRELQTALANNAKQLADAQAALLALSGNATASGCRRFGEDSSAGPYRLAGGGLGHGLGMSQFGAKGAAEHGKGYRQILAHYFQKTTIGEVGNPSVTHGNPKEGFRTEDMDSYVAGVVAGELSATWPMETLKAQAVAARSYAYDLIRGGQNPDDTTSTQEWSNNRTDRDWQAVRETSGQVITYDGRPVTAYYHSSSGGCTENVENVWVTPQPWHRGVSSPWEDDAGNNFWNWQRNFSVTEMERRLGVSGLELIRVSARGVSGRAVNLEIVTSSETIRMTGEEFQGLVGLPSTLFGFK